MVVFPLIINKGHRTQTWQSQKSTFSVGFKIYKLNLLQWGKIPTTTKKIKIKRSVLSMTLNCILIVRLQFGSSGECGVIPTLPDPLWPGVVVVPVRDPIYGSNRLVWKLFVSGRNMWIHNCVQTINYMQWYLTMKKSVRHNTTLLVSAIRKFMSGGLFVVAVAEKRNREKKLCQQEDRQTVI